MTVRFDVKYRLLSYDGKSCRLPPQPAHLLDRLIAHQRNGIPLRGVGGDIRVAMARLRRYLKHTPLSVDNVFGVGYALVGEVERAGDSEVIVLDSHAARLIKRLVETTDTELAEEVRQVVFGH